MGRKVELLEKLVEELQTQRRPVRASMGPYPWNTLPTAKWYSGDEPLSEAAEDQAPAAMGGETDEGV